MHGCVGNAWYVDDSPHLAEVGYFCEQARLVKTVKVHSPIAKWAMDQTVGSYLGGQKTTTGTRDRYRLGHRPVGSQGQ